MKLYERVVELLKLFRGTSDSDTVARIVYELPDGAVYKKFYNQDQRFEDIDWTNWTAIIDGFESRFEKWYFQHMPGGHASYVDLCALCALVEVFSYYESEKDWHEPKNYKEFLRKLDKVFRTSLPEPIQITRFEAGSWKPGKLKDFADVFYTGVRCSLHHHGDLASFAGMSGTGKPAIVLPDAGRSLCGGYKYPLVIFDPAELKILLRRWLQDYCKDLRGEPASVTANRFRRKFASDFGISIALPKSETAPNKTNAGDASVVSTA